MKLPEIQEYDFKSEILDLGFEIINLDYFFTMYGDGKLFIPHGIKFHAVIFVTKGKGLHEIDFKDYGYKENDILFIGKDQIHAWKKFQDVDGFLILFTEDFLHQNQITYKDLSYSYPYNSVLFERKISLQDTREIRTFNELIQYLYDEFNAPLKNETQEILQCLLRAFLLKIRAQNRNSEAIIKNENAALFIRFQKLLDEKISESRNALDYCEWLGVSYRKLNDVCKTLTHKTIKSFIDNIVLLKAKKLLSDGDKNISEVSYLLGFDEVTNFSKYFTKHTNQSPKSFQISYTSG